MRIRNLKVKNYDDYQNIIVDNFHIIKKGLLELSYTKDEEEYQI